MRDIDRNNIAVPDGLKDLLEASMDRAQARKRRRSRIAVSAAAFVVAAFLVLPNTTPAVSQALTGLPLIGDVFSVLTVRDFQDETYIQDEAPRFIADVEIPYIAASDPDAQAEADAVNEEIDNTLKEAIAGYEEAKAAAKDQGFGELLAEGQIVSDSTDYFTLKVTMYTSDASGFLQEDYYTVAKSSGKRVMLADVYGQGCEEAISEDILRQMKEQMAEDDSREYFIGEDGFTGIDADQDFYIDENGDAVICFDEAQEAPAYMGAPQFIVKGL